MKQFLLFLNLLIGVSVVAQEKMLTMDEAVLGTYGSLAPENISGLKWLPESSWYVYTDKEKDSVLHIIDAVSGDEIKEFHLAELNAVFFVRGDQPLTSMPRLHWLNGKEFGVVHNGHMWKYNWESKEIIPQYMYDPTDKSGHIWNENMGATYKEGSTLKVVSPKTAQTIAIDKDNITYGEAAHRFEFGISKGIFWSPTEDKVAFIRLDENPVATYNIYQWDEYPASGKPIHYPVAGKPSHYATLGVKNFSDGTVTYLQTGGYKADKTDTATREKYLTNITWGPEGKKIYIAEVNRAQNHMWLNRYDATSGKFEKTLFEETHDKYVEPEHDLIFVPGSNDQFIWQSERDGYNHLYLYSTEGKLIKQLTSGNWVVTATHGFTEDNSGLYYTSTASGPMERQLFVVDLNKGKSSQITQGAGTHHCSISEKGDFIIDHFTSIEIPRKISLLDSKGKLVKVLLEADNPLTEYKLGKMELGEIKADDGTDLNYRIFYPVDFDAKKKYPVVVYLYNGPHLQLVRNTWLGGANLWYQYMAQQGYIVFSIDGRGSANRGLEFENAVFRQLGTLEMKDQLAGVNWLKSQSFVDADRMGIHGWSFGGFMTISMMTRNAGIFKVGVAGGPVIDWSLYEVMYTERYMDTPKENPEGYDSANLLNYVKDLKGDLMIIHGGEDDVVLWQHSLLYLRKAIKEGVQLDYFVYPHHPHNVRGKDRVHLMQKVTDYLIEGLE